MYPVQLVNDFFVSGRRRYESIAERLPRVSFGLAEAEVKKVRFVIGKFFAREPPHVREKTRAAIGIVFDDRRFGYFSLAERLQRDDNISVCGFLRIPQYLKRVVYRPDPRVLNLQNRFPRQPLDDRERGHPLFDVFAHRVVAEARVNEPAHKLPHFRERLLRRGCSDSVQQLVNVNVRRGNRYFFENALPRLCAPRKIAAQPVVVQVVVRRIVAEKLSIPREIILVVLHESSLSEEIFYLPAVGGISVDVKSPHRREPALFSRQPQCDLV